MDCKKCGKEVDKKQKVFAKKDSQLCRQQTVNNYLRKCSYYLFQSIIGK